MSWLVGVSAWPSHLIHLMALFAILWTRDWAWACTLQLLREDSDWLRLPRPMPQPVVRSNLRELVRAWSEARGAVKDGWHYIERKLLGDFDRDGR